MTENATSIPAWVTELQALASRATPAPWFHGAADDFLCMNAGFIASEPVAPRVWPRRASTIAITLHQVYFYACADAHFDNEVFQAAARETVPQLCDALVRHYGRRRERAEATLAVLRQRDRTRGSLTLRYPHDDAWSRTVAALTHPRSGTMGEWPPPAELTEASRDLAEPATPGPWFVHQVPCPRGKLVEFVATKPEIVDRTPGGRCVVAVTYFDEEPGAMCAEHSANARFIAAARTAVPRLCAELDRLVGQCHELGLFLRRVLHTSWVHEDKTRTVVVQESVVDRVQAIVAEACPEDGERAGPG